MGLCHYRLSFPSANQKLPPARREFHLAKARQAFERVLQLEPSNVDALVALAVMDANRDEGASDLMMWKEL